MISNYDVECVAQQIGIVRQYGEALAVMMATGDGVVVRLRHRCGRSIRIHVDRLMMFGIGDGIVRRICSCVDLGCLCEVTVVTDRDPGDEDLD